MEPITRQEQLLDSIATGNSVELEPITREEQYLSAIAGSTDFIPEKPITRKEMFYEKILESGGVGGDGTLVQQQVDYEENDTSKVTYIKNRPFYTSDGFSYEWDGTAPDETRKVSGDNPQHFYYKISDNIMSVSDLVGAKATIGNRTSTITESSIKTYENGSFCYNWLDAYEMVFVCVETGFFDTWLGTVELTPGLWFLQAGADFNLLKKEAEVKQIDNKYIPKATAIDDENADLLVTAGLVKTELEKKADLVDGKIPAEQIPDGIGSSEGNFVVDLICDITTMSVTSISKTHAEIYSALQNGKQISVRGDFGFSFCYGSVACLEKSTTNIWFQLMIPTNVLTGTLALYYFAAKLSSDDKCVVYPYIVNTTSMGG